MATDLKQFHGAFFEESLEAVDDMETGLLNLDINAVDSESINTIFRAAHSVKGCSATFGFTDIAEFVHVMETVLDEMRDNNLDISQETVDLLLKALDILRAMLVNTRDGESLITGDINAVHDQLNSILKKGGSNNCGDQHNDNKNDKEQFATEWLIRFEPHLDIMKTGNDPLRMFSVLAEMGQFKSKVDTSQLINFRAIDPEDCYLSWTINLAGASSRDEIEELFEWVADECLLDISPVEVTKPEEDIHVTLKNTSNNISTTERPTATSGTSDSASIRVGIDKVDAIINMVGELVITQSMLDQLGSELEEGAADSARYEKLRSGLIQLERNTRELQESVMRIRMLPISYVFNRVPRIVHDLSKKLNKEVNVKMTGESTELDKTVLENIGDPLVHLIRNALDHGIESPEERRAKGKPEEGTIHLNAHHKGGNIIVEIRDDGAGLNKDKIIAKAKQRGIISADEQVTDEQIYDLIFAAGFSTAETVSDVSGRGVGMDVVKKNIKALGGNIDVDSSDGEGTSFTIRLPLTLAILDGQLVRVGSETFIIPLISIIESLQIDPDNVNIVAGQSEVYRLRNEHIPFIRLNELFGGQADSHSINNGLMVVVESDGKRAGLIVDDLLAQQQVVIKSLETNFQRIEGLSGATILGDGTVALIVDVTGLIVQSQYTYTPMPRNVGNTELQNIAAV